MVNDLQKQSRNFMSKSPDRSTDSSDSLSLNQAEQYEQLENTIKQERRRMQLEIVRKL
jgi:hypothetical protein